MEKKRSTPPFGPTVEYKFPSLEYKVSLSHAKKRITLYIYICLSLFLCFFSIFIANDIF